MDDAGRANHPHAVQGKGRGQAKADEEARQRENARKKSRKHDDGADAQPQSTAGMASQPAEDKVRPNHAADASAEVKKGAASAGSGTDGKVGSVVGGATKAKEMAAASHEMARARFSGSETSKTQGEKRAEGAAEKAGPTYAAQRETGNSAPQKAEGGGRANAIARPEKPGGASENSTHSPPAVKRNEFVEIETKSLINPEKSSSAPGASSAVADDIGADLSARKDPDGHRRSLRSEYSQAEAIMAWRSKNGAAAVPAARPGAAPLEPAMPNPTAAAPKAGHADKRAHGAAPGAIIAGTGTGHFTASTPPSPVGSDPGLAFGGGGSAAAPANSVTAQPAVAPALPLPFHPLVDSIRAQIALQGPNHAHSGTDLTLHPAELGRIHFQLTGSGHQLTITIGAENRDTLALLQRHAADLQAELSQEGLGQAAFSFTDLGQGGSGGSSNPMPTPAAVLAEEAPPAAHQALLTPIHPARRIHDGALHLRL